MTTTVTPTATAFTMHSAVPVTATVTAAKPPTVAFTTPENYATRLSHLLTLKGHTPLWCPTIATEITTHTLRSLELHLTPPNLEPFSAIAFPSRTAIAALKTAITYLSHPLLRRGAAAHGRGSGGDAFIIAALGKDAEMIDDGLVSKICSNVSMVKILVPKTATPSGLVMELGGGGGRKVLCPVPLVVGLEEPPVVPDFLRELEAAGWAPVRVNAYETRWVGPTCAERVVARAEAGEGMEAVVFTSSGEVEGLLKSLREFGLDWEWVRRRWPNLVTAAHGPVTAAVAQRLGVNVDVVSDKFDSFSGVVEALDLRLRGLH